MRKQDFTDSNALAEEMRKEFRGRSRDELRLFSQPAISDDGRWEICLELFTTGGIFTLFLNREQYEYTHRVFDQIRERGTQSMAREEQLLRRLWHKEFSPLDWERAFVIDESLPATVVDILPREDVATVLDYWRNKKVEAVDEVVQRVKAEAAVT